MSWVQRADILTFHTPLFKDGPYKNASIWRMKTDP